MCHSHHGRNSRHATWQAPVDLGDTTTRAVDIFGHRPEAYRGRCQAGNCTQREETQVGRNFPVFQRIQRLCFGLCLLHIAWHLASLWITPAKKTKANLTTRSEIVEAPLLDRRIQENNASVLKHCFSVACSRGSSSGARAYVASRSSRVMRSLVSTPVATRWPAPIQTPRMLGLRDSR